MGGEWIRYDGVRGERAQVARDGRGVRGTQPAAHTLDQIVQLGRSFTAVFELSCVREDWGDDPARRNP